MKNAEQARDFIETALNELEKSVSEKDNPAVNNHKQEVNSLISEYGNVLGRKSVNIYTQNYAEIMQKGGYLK